MTSQASNDAVILSQVARYCHVKANFYLKYSNKVKEKFWRGRAEALERIHGLERPAVNKRPM